MTKEAREGQLTSLKAIEDKPAEATFIVGSGKRKVALTVVNFDRDIDDSEVRAEMSSRSLRTVTKEELNLFRSEVLGEEGAGFPILAYGNKGYKTPIKDGGFACTLCLSETGQVELLENWCAQTAAGWPRGFSFLFAQP